MYFHSFFKIELWSVSCGSPIISRAFTNARCRAFFFFSSDFPGRTARPHRNASVRARAVLVELQERKLTLKKDITDFESKIQKAKQQQQRPAPPAPTEQEAA